MLKNYLITAFRALGRQKNTTAINIIGLTLGIAASLVLFLLVQYQYSFDKFQTKYDRIYRVVTMSEGNEGSFYTSGIQAPLPTAFRLDFPEAEQVAFTQYQSGALILIPQNNKESKKYQENRGVVFTEPSIFKIFDREVLIGDAVKGLDEPNEAVISKSLAIKYFNKEDAIGEIIRYEGKDFKIAAVVADPPNNTDLPFSLYLSYETIRKENEAKGWNGIWSDEHCYFLLKEGVNIATLQSRMEAFHKKYKEGENYDKEQYLLEPLANLHFDERFGNYNYNTNSKTGLNALAIIGLFLIITASINFINLTTAEAIKRSKEVGIRKTLGSSRFQLVAQFLGETSLVTGMSLLIALGVAQISLGFLNPFLDLNLSLNFSTNQGLLFFIAIIFVSVSLFSGLYPAFVISAFKPALALKNAVSNRSSSSYYLRKGLVVVQFFISQFLIIGTIVLITQTNYFKSMELGFRKDAIISVPIPIREKSNTAEQGESKMRTLAAELSRISGVEGYSLCISTPSSGRVNGTDFRMEGESEDKGKGTQVKSVDDKYISLFELKMLAGKNIDDLDTPRSVVVNRKFAEVAGFTNPKDIIGKRIQMWGRVLPVDGVIENFHTTSLTDAIEPTVLLNFNRNYRTLSIKVNPKSFNAALPEIQKLWERTYTEHLFEYEFLDETIRGFYETESRISILLTIFTSLAIAIGCLGLFGLATFMINQKNKEIGVRKVLGASVESIVFIFSKEYVKLICVGFILAAPLAWYVMDSWLNEFAYRINMGAWIFLISLGVTLLIAIFTVGYRSLRAAIANPAKSLRYE